MHEIWIKIDCSLLTYYNLLAIPEFRSSKYHSQALNNFTVLLSILSLQLESNSKSSRGHWIQLMYIDVQLNEQLHLKQLKASFSPSYFKCKLLRSIKFIFKCFNISYTLPFLVWRVESRNVPFGNFCINDNIDRSGQMWSQKPSPYTSVLGLISQIIWRLKWIRFV